MAISSKAIGYNAVAAVAVLMLWYGWLSKTASGDWVVNQMLPSNMEMIRETQHLPYDVRWDMKIGNSFRYLDMIVQMTPEDAVILYPERVAFCPPGVESPFGNNELYNKVWATRFLHPRRLVLRSELDSSPYASKITHVAIVNGIGYDIFGAQQPDSASREPFTVIPINL